MAAQVTLTRRTPATKRRLQSCGIGLGVFLVFLLHANLASATAGFAETSWLYHYQANALVRWHHGDICSGEEIRDPNVASPAENIPGKDCFYLIRLPPGTQSDPRLFSVPLKIGGGDFSVYLDVTADSPTLLYGYSAYPLAVLLLATLGPYILYRRVTRLNADGKRGSIVLLGLSGVLIIYAVSQLVGAFDMLFPLSPFGLTSFDFAQLLLNDWIVLSPVVLWLALKHRQLAAPSHWHARIIRDGLILLSSACAPFLVFGPPSIFQLLVPLLLVPNILISLAVVIPLQKGLHYRRRA